ncbi:hypothetical protein UA08_07466 [Talaromyces atroroseus]|uniref:DNA repair protein RAD51 homolog 3 n=1 Tax=Talaromyces atroroseus TaxID=1441469 RepID=A0A225AJ10_TALAT|nr:hypothetical protein UA08_07466 [Talaromyces atroroseus]OKL57138.1 hypothetical protein UA08_07466 [Talaromyces atroroseus]
MTDYDFLTEPGIPRVSSISASQALRASSSLLSTPYPFPAVPAPLPTGLDRLDDALRTATAAATDYAASPARSGHGPSAGGIPRGSITEIYGPPGVGKTAVSLNIAATTLVAGEDEKVVWIDTGSPIPTLRLKELLTSKLMLQSNDYSIDKRLSECMNRFHHIRAPTLPHLLSLFAHPPPNFPAEGTSLLIVDSISAPFQSYFPNSTELRSRLQTQGQGHAQGTENQQKQATQWLLNRKWNVISDMANKLVKLATTTTTGATTNRPKMAIILLNQTHTKIKGQPRPTLYPAVGGGQSWENCVQTRIVLYRDWWSGSSESSKVGGLRELRSTQQEQQSIPRSTPILSVRKRKVDEVADSEDDNVEDDDSEFVDGNEDDFQWDNAVDTGS